VTSTTDCYHEAIFSDGWTKEPYIENFKLPFFLPMKKKIQNNENLTITVSIGVENNIKNEHARIKPKDIRHFASLIYVHKKMRSSTVY